MRILLKSRMLWLLGSVAALSACQGSQLGSKIEGAIAPVKETPIAKSPEAIAPSPSPIFKITPTSTATNPNLKKILEAIALPPQPQSIISKQISKQISPQPSLTAYLAIKFASPTATSFSDIDQAPKPLQPWLNDLQKLGTIEAKVRQEFQPNIAISRREYARWLLQTNNRLYQKQPSRQIRLAPITDNPSFSDIPKNHPDFAIIQGLANAGLIAGDRFRPNDPLLREELVQWKIPLDIRKPLPIATIENIEQSWGFQDSDRLSETAIRAIFADGQLGDLSNIRRSFGFTTILQPQKPVTRAEAAASLWHFGTAIDGISAPKALEN